MSENFIRYGLQKGISTPKDQFKETSAIDITQIENPYIRDAKRAHRSLRNLQFLNYPSV